MGTERDQDLVVAEKCNGGIILKPTADGSPDARPIGESSQRNLGLRFPGGHVAGIGSSRASAAYTILDERRYGKRGRHRQASCGVLDIAAARCARLRGRRRSVCGLDRRSIFGQADNEDETGIWIEKDLAGSVDDGGIR